MKRGYLFILWLFLLLFSMATLYISFTSYVYEREKKVIRVMGEFLNGVLERNREVNLSLPEMAYLMYIEERTGERFISSNINVGNIDRDAFLYSSVETPRGTLYVYVRKMSLEDFLGYILSQPMLAGLIVASLFLYVSVFYYTVKELEVSSPSISDELIKRLKALRLTLATFKIIPEESVEEMKKIVDGILKSALSKK